MKITANHPLARYVDVYLDGNQVSGVVFANEEAGTIEAYDRDANGMFTRPLATVRRTGKVEIRVRANDAVRRRVATALMATPRGAVYYEIDRERERQDTQWGGPSHDDEWDERDWETTIQKHVRRLTGGLGQPLDDYRSRLVKIAALAVAAVEAHDRRVEK